MEVASDFTGLPLCNSIYLSKRSRCCPSETSQELIYNQNALIAVPPPCEQDFQPGILNLTVPLSPNPFLFIPVGRAHITREIFHSLTVARSSTAFFPKYPRPKLHSIVTAWTIETNGQAIWKPQWARNRRISVGKSLTWHFHAKVVRRDESTVSRLIEF